MLKNNEIYSKSHLAKINNYDKVTSTLSTSTLTIDKQSIPCKIEQCKTACVDEDQESEN